MTKLYPQGVDVCESLEIRVGGLSCLIHNRLQYYTLSLHFEFWQAPWPTTSLWPQISPSDFCLLLHLFKRWLNLRGYSIYCSNIPNRANPITFKMCWQGMLEAEQGLTTFSICSGFDTPITSHNMETENDEDKVRATWLDSTVMVERSAIMKLSALVLIVVCFWRLTYSRALWESRVIYCI